MNKEFYDKELQRFINTVGSPTNEKYHYYTHEWTCKHVKKGQYVLDVGTGIGTLPYLLSLKGANPVGIDISEVGINKAKECLPGLMFHQMNADSLQFQDNLFDVVTSNQLLEHVENPEIVIKEMLRVLKPKGILLITVPINNRLDVDNRDVGHINHWRYYDLMELFEKFGNNFKIYWINKFIRKNEEGAIMPKNVFAVRFING